MAQQKNQQKMLMVLCHYSKLKLTLLLILVMMKTLQNFGAIVASLLFGKMITCNHKKNINRWIILNLENHQVACSLL